jgi:hypothetical protein
MRFFTTQGENWEWCSCAHAIVTCANNKKWVTQQSCSYSSRWYPVTVTGGTCYSNRWYPVTVTGGYSNGWYPVAEQRYPTHLLGDVKTTCVNLKLYLRINFAWVVRFTFCNSSLDYKSFALYSFSCQSHFPFI